MMTIDQFLLLKVMEECAEVQQRCSKAMQFGPDEAQPSNPFLGNNRQRLHEELLDLDCLLEICRAGGLIPKRHGPEFRKAFKAKRTKLAKYLAYSRQLGMVGKGMLP